MSRQVNYIIYAVLTLSACAIGLLLVHKIFSVTIVAKENEAFFSGTNARHSPNFSVVAVKGKSLFLSKCASCHSIFKDMTGPALLGFEGRGLWADQNKLYEWIKDPSSFMKKDIYTRKLKEQYGSVMTAFPGIRKEEVNAIAQYINESNVDNLPVP